MANSVDPDQTAPIGAVCSGSTLFVSTLNSLVMLGNHLQQTTSADDNFRCIFFIGALRVYFMFLLSSYFLVFWSLPRGAIVWSLVCDRDISWFTHLRQMYFPILINWTCPFPILGLLVVFFIFIQILKETSVCKQWRT